MRSDLNPTTEESPSLARRARAIVIACCLLPVASCSLVPDYMRPATDTAARWNLETGALRDAVPARGEWWRQFSSPELDGLMRQALNGNFDLQAAVARIDQARGTAQVSAAPLYPFLTLAATRSSGTVRRPASARH